MSAPATEAAPAPATTSQGQPAQTGQVSLEHIAKRRGQLESMQKRMQELIEHYNETIKKLGLDNWPTSIPSLGYTRRWLTAVRIYYALLEIEEQIRAGLLLGDEEWINLKKRVDGLAEELKEVHKATSERFLDDLIYDMRNIETGIVSRVYRLLPYASITIKNIVRERDEIQRVLDEITEEMRAIEREK